METQLQTESQNLPALTSQGEGLSAWANTLVITDVEGSEQAKANLAELKKAIKTVEADKEEVYRPIKTALDAVAKKYKPVLDMLESAEKIVRQKIAIFEDARMQEERRRLEAERKAREEQALKDAAEKQAAAEAEAARIKADADARAQALREAGQVELAQATLEQAEQGAAAITAAVDKAIDDQFAAASKVQEVAKTTKTAAGAFTVRKVWKFEVVNMNVVPPEFIMLDTAKVQAAINSGSRSITGLRIFEDAVGSMR